MGPKAEAACRFVEATGRPATIGSLTAATAVLAGTAGTTVTVASPAYSGEPHSHKHSNRSSSVPLGANLAGDGRLLRRGFARVSRA
jgi:hypothetical protein